MTFIINGDDISQVGIYVTGMAPGSKVAIADGDEQFTYVGDADENGEMYIRACSYVRVRLVGWLPMEFMIYDDIDLTGHQRVDWAK